MSRPLDAPTLSTPPHVPPRLTPSTKSKSRSGYRRSSHPALPSSPGPANAARRSSVAPTPKAQRTSKTTQKLVLLPSAPQTKPLRVRPLPSSQPTAAAAEQVEREDEDVLGYETDAGVIVREYKSAPERMTKEQREREGYKRLTAYCVAEALKTKLLASFLKREHNVSPRVFDEAMYVMYHLPLLPGYGPNANIRSSAPPRNYKAHLSRLSEAEENGYQGSYFAQPPESGRQVDTDGYMTSRTDQDGYTSQTDGYMTSGSPVETSIHPPPIESDVDGTGQVTGYAESESDITVDGGTADLLRGSRREDDRPLEAYDTSATADAHAHAQLSRGQIVHDDQRSHQVTRDQDMDHDPDQVAEVVFFAYGVAVFYGFSEVQERGILEDLEIAGVLKRPIREEDWEIEACHFAHDPSIAYPRIYNDFFTFKSPSHLLKLSVAHALAQSTLLATYERTALLILSDPKTLSIPHTLSLYGTLSLKRRDALRLTGRLFKLRRDVNLVSNVLDVPELFWSEASLGGLYEAVREYMEIEGRVRGLNEKLGVASDFLDVIHDHLNNNAMERITWIVIWLIILVIFVEVGEVFARLVVHKPVAAAIGRTTGRY
ncbi:hypothetical protein F5I97DRAFT_1060802 [Phlebopus sp. FC_14]|nr:hypothetical protein F5I97DRAFT_1060802 [Phlebopus sp. FC_14]